MPKKLNVGTVPRKSAIWVQPYHHQATSLCSRVLGITSGEFVEMAVDAFVDSTPSLAALKPALDAMQSAIEQAEKTVAAGEEEGGEE